MIIRPRFSWKSKKSKILKPGNRLFRATAERRKPSGTAETISPRGVNFRNSPRVFRPRLHTSGNCRNHLAKRNMISETSEAKTPE